MSDPLQMLMGDSPLLGGSATVTAESCPMSLIDPSVVRGHRRLCGLKNARLNNRSNGGPFDRLPCESDLRPALFAKAHQCGSAFARL